MNCIFYKAMKCQKPHGMLGLCEKCKIPNSFGYFFNLDKPGAEQRFILERDRIKVLSNIAASMAQLEEMRDRILTMPSRDEYYRRKKDES